MSEKTRQHKRDYQNAWRKRPYVRERRKVSLRVGRLKYKYGLTLDAFNTMLIGQGSVCAACGTSEWGGHGPSVDHDHITGNIRGILCPMCNTAAGLLRDSPNLARSLADYLERTAT